MCSYSMLNDSGFSQHTKPCFALNIVPVPISLNSYCSARFDCILIDTDVFIFLVTVDSLINEIRVFKNLRPWKPALVSQECEK